MPFSVKSAKSGQTYFLHSKETESRGGKRNLFFFSKVADDALESMPEGYIVTEAPTGLPLLKKAPAK